MSAHIFEGKQVKTYGDMGEIVAAIAKSGDRARAKRFLESYRDYCQECGQGREVADANVGYWTGYLDADLARKAREVFAVEHPIFGKVTPTAEEALQSGYAMGRGENPRVDPTQRNPAHCGKGPCNSLRCLCGCPSCNPGEQL